METSGTNLGRGRGKWMPRDRERNNPNGSDDRPGNFRCSLNDLTDGGNLNAQLQLGVCEHLFQADPEGRDAQPSINIQQNPLVAPDLSPLEQIMINMVEDGRRRESTLMQLFKTYLLTLAKFPHPPFPHNLLKFQATISCPT